MIVCRRTTSGLGNADGVVNGQFHFRPLPAGTQPHAWAGVMNAVVIGARQIDASAVVGKMLETESSLGVGGGFGHREQLAADLRPQHHFGAGQRRLAGGADHDAFNNAVAGGRNGRQYRTRQNDHRHEHCFGASGPGDSRTAANAVAGGGRPATTRKGR